LVTTEVALRPLQEQRRATTTIVEGVWLSCALTPLVILIHGYHPYAEDGGVYLAGAKRLLDPRLYPHLPGFVTTHLQFSLFAPAMAALVRATHLGLLPVLFGVYAASIWLTLFSGWMVAKQWVPRTRARCGAVCVLAMSLTAPVAGTSLMLMDPYVTARSISTPLGLLALAAALKIADALQYSRVEWKAIAACVGSLAIAAAAHPLMAAYSLSCVVVLVCVSIPQRTARMMATGTACCMAVLLAGCLQWLGPKEAGAYGEVARTRTYWFLSNWQWYELFGLVAPVAVLAILARLRSGEENRAERQLAWMAVICGAVATAIVVLFVRADATNYLVAELQPLRVYQMIYAVMFLAIGAFLAERYLKASAVRWIALMTITGGCMLLVQHETFPDSAHIELPGKTPANAWEQAFTWVRTHTAKDALFALDANYITAPGEDAQNFRAIAERSSLPDFAKDGGIASIAPELTREWLDGEVVQRGLNNGVGPGDIAQLRARGVGWVIVLRTTPAMLPCVYANNTVKICRVP